MRTLIWTLILFLAPAIHAETDIWTAGRDGDLERVRALLDAGVDVDAETRYRATALYFAAQRGHLELVDFLLKRGADVEIRDTFWQYTPLAGAVFEGQTAVALRLLEHGARDPRYLLLDEAARRGDTALVKALIDQGRIYEFEREVALKTAHREHHEEIVALLKKARTRSELKTIDLPADALDRLIGTYREESGAEELVISRSRDEGEAVLQGAYASRIIPLVPLSPEHFRSPEDPSIGVVFSGRLGMVEGAELTHMGRKVALRRFHPEAASNRTAAEKAVPSPTHDPSVRSKPLDWPSFRGPNASGVADGQDPPITWDVATGTNVRFKAPIPGLGNSSPVVWGDRVFLTTAVSGKGDHSLGYAPDANLYGNVNDFSEHTWRVLALDKTSGEVIWQKTVASGIPDADRHGKSSHANSTPATDGRHLVVVFPSAGLFCYSQDGELLWQRELGALTVGDFFDHSIEWGYGASPVIYDDRVILQVDVNEGGYLAAYALADGHELWKVPRAEMANWASPTLYRGKRDEVIASGSMIRGYDPANGRELWRLGPSSEISVATPIAGDGLIYVTAGYPPVRPIYAVRPGAVGDISLPAGTTQSAAVAWSHDRGGSYLPTPVVYRGILYVLAYNARLVAYEAATGEIVYRARLSRRGQMTGSPVAADGRLYFASEEGHVFVVEAGRQYRELAVNDMGEAVMTVPAVSDGTLFIRSHRHLWALGI